MVWWSHLELSERIEHGDLWLAGSCSYFFVSSSVSLSSVLSDETQTSSFRVNDKNH